MRHDCAFISQIGVSSAIEALLREGFNVATPVVDMGYDLLALDGSGRCWRLQVKSASGREGTRCGRRVHLVRGWRRSQSYDATHIDAFILVNLRTRDVWCLPIREVRGRKYINWNVAAQYGGVSRLRRVKSQRC